MKKKFIKFAAAVIVAAAAIFGGYTLAPGVIEHVLCSYAVNCEG